MCLRNSRGVKKRRVCIRCGKNLSSKTKHRSTACFKNQMTTFQIDKNDELFVPQYVTPIEL